MAPNLLFLAFAISLIISTASSSHSSIYDLLRSHALPIGLLPKGITNFSIDPSTGRFEVHLTQACGAKFETQVRYDWNISGTLRYGQIGELSGVTAQELFLWFPVKGIRVDIPSSGIIYFDVGVVFKQFSLSSFDTPRDCSVTGPISPPAQLFSFQGGRQPIVENQSGKIANEVDPRGVELRAVS